LSEAKPIIGPRWVSLTLNPSYDLQSGLRKIDYAAGMTRYRRNFLSGGSFFFTINLADRRLQLLTEHIDLLRAAFRYTRSRHSFALDAIVVLPEHLHAIWTLPDGDADFAVRWRLIKSTFSRKLPGGERISASRAERGERGIWQRRYWEHTLRDEDDLARHMDYVHFNPVKHGHVTRVRDWPFSSFHRLVKLGLYPPDWGGDISDVVMQCGER
jgi:putative transposase